MSPLDVQLVVPGSADLLMAVPAVQYVVLSNTISVFQWQAAWAQCARAGACLRDVGARALGAALAVPCVR